MQKGCNHISTLRSDQESTGLFQNCLKESLLLLLPPPLSAQWSRASSLRKGRGGRMAKQNKKKAVLSNKLNCHLTWAVLHHFGHVEKHWRGCKFHAPNHCEGICVCVRRICPINGVDYFCKLRIFFNHSPSFFFPHCLHGVARYDCRRIILPIGFIKRLKTRSSAAADRARDWGTQASTKLCAAIAAGFNRATHVGCES